MVKTVYFMLVSFTVKKKLRAQMQCMGGGEWYGKEWGDAGIMEAKGR